MFKRKEKKPLFECVKKGHGMSPQTGYHVQIEGKTVAMFQTFEKAQAHMLTNEFLAQIYDRL